MASNVNANSGLIYKHCDKCGEPLYYGTSHICESSTDMVRKALAARDKEWVVTNAEVEGEDIILPGKLWRDRRKEIGI